VTLHLPKLARRPQKQIPETAPPHRPQQAAKADAEQLCFPPLPLPRTRRAPAMSRRTALAPAAAAAPASASAPFVAADGEAHDAELERRWASVHAGLVAVLESLEDADDGGTEAGDDDDDEDASRDDDAPRAAKRRRTSEVNPDAWMTVWADVHALFQHRDPKKKRRMYERVREFLKGYVREQLAALRARLGGDGVMLLREYKRRWDKSVQFVKSMKRMLHHLQHFWVPENCNLSKENPIRPLDRLLMFYWREELLAELPEITGIVLGMIDDDRCGKPIDHAPVKAVIDTLVILGGADANPMHDVSPIPCAPSRPGPSILDLGRNFRAPLSGSTTRHSIYDDPVDPTESLHLYLQVFEDEFLKRTAVFYASEADKMMRGSSVSLFMQDVVGRMDEEIARGQRLLHPDSVLRLRSTVEEKLVGAHMQYLQSQADSMVRDGREDDLRMVFKLLERLEGGLGPIRDYLTKFIVEEGTEMMRARAADVTTKQDVKMSLAVVDDMVKLHKERTEMIQRCFGGSQIFVKALDDAFNSFMNRPIGSLMMAEVLAYYMDSLLRNPRVSIATVGTSKPPFGTPALQSRRPLRGKELTLTANGATKCPAAQPPVLSAAAEGVTAGRAVAFADGSIARGAALDVAGDNGSCLDEPIVQQMDRIIRLFLYVDDKDLFHETYRRSLAKRLLNKHDDVLEREFISKLKMQTGAVYTGKISGMFQDVIISNEERQKFRTRCEQQLDAKVMDKGDFVPWREVDGVGDAVRIDFGAHVLNALYWPTFQEDRLNIPHTLVQWQRTFGEFYMRNKESRRIAWIHSQSTNLVAAQLNGNEYTLHVSTFQACILLQFNVHQRRSLAQLATSLNIQPSVLARHMQPLVASKKSPLFICLGNLMDVPATLPGYATSDAAIEAMQLIVSPLFEVAKEVRESVSKAASAAGNGSENEGIASGPTTPDDAAEVDVGDDDDLDEEDGVQIADEDSGSESNEPDGEAADVAPHNVYGGMGMFGEHHVGENDDDDIVGDDDGSDSDAADAANLGEESVHPAFAGEHATVPVTQPGGAASENNGDDLVPDVADMPAAHAVMTLHGGPDVAGYIVVEEGDASGFVAPSQDVPPNIGHQEAADALSLLGNLIVPQGEPTMPHEQPDNDGSAAAEVSWIAALQARVPQVSATAPAGTVQALPEANDVRDDAIVEAGPRPREEAFDDDGAVGAISDDEDRSADGDDDAGAGAGAGASANAPPSARPGPSPGSPSGDVGGHPDASGNDAAHSIFYELVPQFSSRTLRIQYPAQIARATTQEAAVTRQNVVIDRNSLLDATLVRVMKQRKTLGYQQLMAEVLSQVAGTFKPEARAVKDRLEHLIEREFIERSPDDATVYVYTA
jgi:Cullin family/Cullin protein neddylation domain